MKDAFIERLEAKEEPKYEIRRAMETTLEPYSFVTSIKKIESFYSKEKFNVEAKFCLLRTASMVVLEPAPFQVYSGATDLQEARKAIVDLGCSKKDFICETWSLGQDQFV